MKSIAKKIAAITVLICLFFLWTIPAAADFTYVSDEKDLLSEEEEEILSERFKSISTEYNLKIMAVTVSDYTTEDELETFCQNWFIDYDISDGIMLAVSEHVYFVCTRGAGKDKFSNTVIKSIQNEFLSSLIDGDYYNAFKIFASSCESRLRKLNSNELQSDSTPEREISPTPNPTPTPTRKTFFQELAEWWEDNYPASLFVLILIIGVIFLDIRLAKKVDKRFMDSWADGYFSLGKSGLTGEEFANLNAEEKEHSLVWSTKHYIGHSDNDSSYDSDRSSDSWSSSDSSSSSSSDFGGSGGHF